MKHLLAQGLGDAVGFVVGALLGFFAGQLLGCDVFDAGYSTRSMVGIALVGLGGAWDCKPLAAGCTGKPLTRMPHEPISTIECLFAH
jgi:hypothetical protein